VGNTRSQTFLRHEITNPIGLPSLYHESFDLDISDGRRSFSNAFVPAPVNLQWTNGGIAAVAQQYGPRDSNDKDVFEEKLREILGPNMVPLDDWDYYHTFFGEVHCGSAAERTPEEFWWTK
jgi:hypothetical protein